MRIAIHFRLGSSITGPAKLQRYVSGSFATYSPGTRVTVMFQVSSTSAVKRMPALRPCLGRSNVHALRASLPK